MLDVILAVDAANPNKTYENLARRIIKLGEEFGELSEAYLNASKGPGNHKGKTWDDVLEEAVDTAIVAIDVATTIPPDRNYSSEEHRKAIEELFKVKLQKWLDNDRKSRVVEYE